MKKSLILFVPFLILFGCNNSTSTNESETKDTFVLPEGAVPIVYVRHIYIPSVVDSIEGNFVFDTGADGLYLDSIFHANSPFRKFNTVNAFIPGVGTGGHQRIIVITDTVNFGFKGFNNNPSFVAVLSLKPILGDFADGILGGKYFANQILEINYLHQYIRLHDDFSIIDTSEYTKINMKNVHGRLFVPVTIQVNDEVTIQDYAKLDIGSRGSVSLTRQTAQKYNLSKIVTDKILSYRTHGGISGATSGYSFRANVVEIGSYRLDNVVMSYSEDRSGSLSQRNDIGLLGNTILERFDVIIDFINSDLYLKANSNFNKPFDFCRLGFTYVDRSVTMNAWIVNGLFRSSNAEIAGLKSGDKIISVNGISIHEISFSEQPDFWRKTNTATLVVLRNGKERNVEFELKSVL